MASNFDAILSELFAKKKELDAQYNAVRNQALDECRKMVEQFEFTAEELNIPTATKAQVKTEKTTRKVEPKYQNPLGNETWSGRGARKPEWFLEALNQGYSVEDMLIKK